MSDNVVPFCKTARDGRRVLRDISQSENWERYARVPDKCSVQLSLPTALIEKIDQHAQRELLSRGAWCRRQIALALRAEEDEKERA